MYRKLLVLILLASSQQAFCLSFGDVLSAIKSQAQGQVQTKQAGSSQAQSGEGTQSVAPLAPEDEQLMQAGMWRDPKTGLTWMRCPLGDTVANNLCQHDKELSYSGYWWDAAQVVKKLTFGGYSDWRLPTVEELAGIHKTCKAPPPPDPNLAPSDPFKPDYVTFTTPRGVTQFQRNCPNYDDKPSVNRAIFPFISDNLQSYYDNFWTSTPNGEINAAELDARYAVKERMWSVVQGTFRQSPYNASSDTQLGVLAVRGGSYDEFNQMLAAVPVAQDEMNAAQRDYAKHEQQLNEQYQANIKAKQQAEAQLRARIVAFRKTVKVGDQAGVYITSTQQFATGVVLAINGDLIQIQTYNPPLTLWYQRSVIVPAQ